MSTTVLTTKDNLSALPLESQLRTPDKWIMSWIGKEYHQCNRVEICNTVYESLVSNVEDPTCTHSLVDVILSLPLVG